MSTAEELAAEIEELRDALRDLLTLRQAAEDNVSGQYPHYRRHLRAAWKRAAELVHSEDGPSS